MTTKTMTNEKIPSVSTDTFAIEVDQTSGEDELTVRLSGDAGMRAVEHLSGFIPRVHDHAVEASVPHVSVDFTRLEFMNSSCFRTFVQWIEMIRKLSPDDQYRLKFVTDPTHHWQRPSLNALSCFATKLVEIVEAP